MADQVIHTEVVVDRPASEVWAVVADLASYSLWNPMYRFENTRLVPGTKATLVITMGRFPARLAVEIEEVIEGTIFRWGSGKSWLGGSHFLKVEAISPTQTRLIHGEQFRGLRLIWPLVTKPAHKTYQAVADALRDYVVAQNA